MQKIVNQRVDRDHCGTGFKPERPLRARADQQRRKRHHEYLVGDAVDVAKRSDQGFLPGGLQFGRCRAFRAFQLLVDPANKVAVGDVTDEQEKRICGLVQSPVAEARPGQGARIDVVGFRAGKAGLVVSAAFEMPVAAELGARGHILLARFNRRPGCRAMLVDIVARDAVRDALEAKGRNEPIKNRRRVGEGDSPT